MARRLRRRKSSNSFDSSNDSGCDAKQPLILPEVKNVLTSRKKHSKTGSNFLEMTQSCLKEWTPSSFVDPYQKVPETWFSIWVQVIAILVTILLCLYTWYCFDHFHYHLTHFYAHHVDDQHAQHVLGHKLIRQTNQTGDLHQKEAFKWFRRSADQGHAHSAYNLAVGHLSGYRTDVKPGEVRQLLRFAAKNGVHEARQLLQGLCREKPKYCDM